MEALVNSVSLVTLAEMGDKTQLLSILLAARFRVFWPIFWGILAATTANHALAAYAGSLISSFTDEETLKNVSALLFIGIGIWVLFPDKKPLENKPKYGAFLTALITFFIAEMADKTQIATIALGAKYEELWAVIAGTTLGMMIANAPAIYFGERIMQHLPLKAFRIVACILFIGFGVFSLLY